MPTDEKVIIVQLVDNDQLERCKNAITKLLTDYKIDAAVSLVQIERQR